MKLIQSLKLIELVTKFKIDKGFWITMGISLFVAILMVVVFWCLPPKAKK